MRREPLTGRETLLVFLGGGITLILFVSANSFWQHSVQRGLVSLMVALALTFIFFRHRKIVFVIIGLSFILVNVGLTNLFHPSVLGYLLIFGSGGGLWIMIRWQVVNHPELTRKHMHELFNHDPDWL